VTGTANVNVVVNGGAGNAGAGSGADRGAGAVYERRGGDRAEFRFSLSTTRHIRSRPEAPSSRTLTGSGPVSPAVADGAPTPLSPLTQITLSKSGTDRERRRAGIVRGLTATFIGLVQFNIVVPAGNRGGNVSADGDNRRSDVECGQYRGEIGLCCLKPTR